MNKYKLFLKQYSQTILEPFNVYSYIEQIKELEDENLSLYELKFELKNKISELARNIKKVNNTNHHLTIRNESLEKDIEWYCDNETELDIELASSKSISNIWAILFVLSMLCNFLGMYLHG